GRHRAAPRGARLRRRTRSHPVSAARPLAALGLLLVSLLGVSRAHAEAEVLERVVAVVNEEAILLSDVRSRAAPFLAQLAAAPEAERAGLVERLYGQVIDALIDEELLRQAARQM